jgi:hypothetical protein
MLGMTETNSLWMQDMGIFMSALLSTRVEVGVPLLQLPLRHPPSPRSPQT